MDVSEKLSIKSLSMPFLVTEESSNLLRNVDNYFPIDMVTYIRRFYIRFNNRLFKYNIDF
jgi:hypothetical protein